MSFDREVLRVTRYVGEQDSPFYFFFIFDLAPLGEARGQDPNAIWSFFFLHLHSNKDNFYVDRFRRIPYIPKINK